MSVGPVGKKNHVIAHFKDGKLLKGSTHDFTPGRGFFHLVSEMAEDNGTIQEIRLSDLKAVFFVKTLEGKKNYQQKTKFEEVDASTLKGLKIKVEFADGEILRGVSLGYSKDKPGFFVIPVDPEGNNERVYVVADSCRDVKVGSAAQK